MKFDNAFTVAAPVEEVWAALLDVERVAPCMPGAEVLDRVGDDAYRVAIRVKVGPISMRYRGEVEVVDRDESARTATMHAKAREARGQGTADANVRMALSEQPDGTRAELETEVQLSGKVAAMGSGVIQDVSARLVETFAGNLAQMLEGGQPGANGAPPAAAAEPAPPVEPAPAAESPSPAESSLPVGKLAAGVIAGRLADPRALLGAAGVLAAVFLAIGYVLGRAR